MPELNWKQHLSEEKLELYSLGRLPEAEVASAEEHLLFCGSCQTRLEKFDEYHKTMRAGLDRLAQESGTQRPRSWWTSSKAFAAIAAGLVLFVLAVPALRRDGPPQIVELAATRSSAAATMESGRTADLRLSATGLDAVSDVLVEVVDLNGTRIWSGSSKLSEGQWTASVGKLDRGAYWVRVYPSGAQQGADALREFALTVK